VTLVNANGDVEERPGTSVPWTYRSSGLGPVVVLAATIELEDADPSRLQEEIDDNLRWRRAGTPFNEPCCGSVFRNPGSSQGGEETRGRGGRESRTAGQLIDAAGMKGFRVGGAEVSRVHANYIVNTGGATAVDVLGVIAAVRKRVMDEFGVELELEARVLENREPSAVSRQP